jgi:N-acylneuraminate cytidylyltransferase
MDEDILADLAANLPPLGIDLPEIWIRLKPTSPFQSVASVEAALAALAGDGTLDSASVVSPADARLQTIARDGFLEPLLPGWDPKRSVMRRAEVPGAYKPFNLHVFRHAVWLERGAAYMGRRIKPIVEHKITGLDIDDQDDFDLVKALIETRPRPDFLARFIHDPA